ncbi:MAG: hypothetical protein U0166_11985 [Acidobacteriota bacterium]
MRNTVQIVPLVTLTVVIHGNPAIAADGFEGVTCDSDVAKTLAGRHMSNERVVVLEARHKDIGLKDLGGSEISDVLFLSSWQICGSEYMLLEEKQVVRDVLKVPPHSRAAPEFIGTCRAGDKELDDVVAILAAAEGKESLAATAAWRIDVKEKRFVKLETDGLRCPRDGIITQDGGM